ncbi:MAG TPA: hypothetical protein VL523_20440 [Terriglobia bacterium]|nr:hypothetical protein [Terriglobia bacterium]
MPTDLKILRQQFKIFSGMVTWSGTFGLGLWQYQHGGWPAAIGAGFFGLALLQSLQEIVYQLLVIADATHPD